jgi:hypothetical protein
MPRRRHEPDETTAFWADDQPTALIHPPLPDDEPMPWISRHQMGQVINTLDFLSATVRFSLYGSTRETISRAVTILRAPEDAGYRERLQGYAAGRRHSRPGRRDAQVTP